MAFRYGLLFIPYVLAALLNQSPSASYLAAWSGSFWILYLTLSGSIKPLPGGRSLARQLFRPIGLTQLMFAGYTAITSIFYFLDLNGYFYLSHNPFSAGSLQQLALTAEAQRYYVLAHAAFATGVLLAMDYRRSGEWTLQVRLSRPWLLLYLAGGLFVGAQALNVVPGLGQVQMRLKMLTFVASVLSLAVSIVQGRKTLIAANGVVYGINLVGAFLSGWKSEVLVAFILLFMFLYPAYKRAITIVAPAVLVLLLAILPTYAGVFRSLNWQGSVQAEEAAQVAFDRVTSGEASLAKSNWAFMTGRLSEIKMFTTYIDHVPDERPYYQFELVEHGLIGIVPRVVWPGKPNMEKLASHRVYAAGVVREGMRVSAKPKFVVDAYLSGGAIGVFLGFILYGLMASWASRLAERWFGGYLLGSGLVYTALFKVFWLSNTFEFFFNTVFWSFMVMGTLFVGGRMTGFLVRESEEEKVPA
ncbi:hypothetical protein GGQ18_002974 [Salinibacter ruber]|uniref:exosortase Y-associated Wzy-like protein n=1 Tax=Salinibacter ruber TaxID=146919 RepID=UPI001609B23E|nr:hypothetical protein [Salinibacter ruber]MBB4070365.1 hypothetical protein [Salinibacter ruber]